jgi:translation initiation factor IF-2
VRTELLQHEIVVETMSGDTLEVAVSALKRTNLDKLLEAIALQAELLDLKANPDRLADGFVIEAKLERGRGPVGTLLVQRGTISGRRHHRCRLVEWGRVRALIDDTGHNVAKKRGPSVPVEVLGFDNAPEAGDQFAVVENEARAREITDYRIRKRRETLGTAGTPRTLEQMMQSLKDTGKKEFPLVVKGDVQGSVEAIMGALAKLGNDRGDGPHRPFGRRRHHRIRHQPRARLEGGHLGFNVRANTQAKRVGRSARRRDPLLLDHLRPRRRGESGHVRPARTDEEARSSSATPRSSRSSTSRSRARSRAASSRKARSSAAPRFACSATRPSFHEGTLAILKRFKDDVKEVPAGQECGMAFANYQDIREDDEIECFQVETIARTL